MAELETMFAPVNMHGQKALHPYVTEDPSRCTTKLQKIETIISSSSALRLTQTEEQDKKCQETPSSHFMASVPLSLPI